RSGHYIACSGCDSSSTMFTAAKDDVRELLIETWNRRAAPAVEVEDDIRKDFGASARAMLQLANHGPEDDLRDGLRELSTRMFRVLNGLPPSALSAQVQDVAGWQLVPKEPTDEMIDAYVGAAIEVEPMLSRVRARV